MMLHCSGMGDQHTTVEKYSLVEHAQLRHSLHHKILLEHQRQGRIFLPENFASEPLAADDSEWTLDDYYFLQPVPARQRRSILRAAGVGRIDPMEREECRSLRLSRSHCGCSCRDVCRPPSCPCCRSGIGCQVDQMAFPCSCSRGSCANPHGRVEFNAARVRAHFIRTLLQLGLESNGEARCDEGLPPPEKRCCLDSDHLPLSVSLPSLPAFSSSSTSPLLPVSSTSVSVSTASRFETQRVYFDTAERLPDSETVVMTYDEDYDDEEEEDSSETSSEGDDASFDRKSEEADCEIAAVPNDPQQRTLDDYVVRFRRQHTEDTDLGPSNCSTAGFTTGFQFTSLPMPLPNSSGAVGVTSSFHFTPLPVPALSPSNTSTAGVTSGFKFTPLPVPQPWPSDSVTAGITRGFHFPSLPIPQTPPRNCSTANVTTKFQFTPLPIPQPPKSNNSSANIATGFQFAPLSVPSANTPVRSMVTSITASNSSLHVNLSSVATSGLARQCSATLNTSVDISKSYSVLCSLASVSNMPSDTRQHSALSVEHTHACSGPEVISGNCCALLTTTHECPHICHIIDDTTYNCSVSNDHEPNDCTRQETTDNCTAHYDSADTNSTPTYSTQQDATHIQSSSDDTKLGSYSLLDDTATGICSTARDNCTVENTRQDSSEPDVTDSDSSGHNATLGLDAEDRGSTIDSTVFSISTAALQDNTYRCCGPDDTVPADCCKVDDNDTQGFCTADHTTHRRQDATCGCSVQDVGGTHDVNLVSDDDNTPCGTNLDYATPQYILPGNTNSCLMTEANTGDVSSVPGHCCLDNSSPSCSATDLNNVVHRSSTSENATNGQVVPDITVDGCSMPCDPINGSVMPENSVGSSQCAVPDTALLTTAAHSKTDEILSVSHI